MTDTPEAVQAVPQKSEREKLADLMNAVRVKEVTAIKDAAAYLAGSDAQAFRAKIAEFHDRTVPGSHADQILGAMLSVFDNNLTMATKTVEAEQKIETAKAEAEVK